MNSIFGSSLFTPAKAMDAQSVFHGDRSLHDQRPVTRSWFNSESLRSDIPAGLRLLKAQLQGLQAEEAVALCAALPIDDPLRKALTAKSVHTLWGSLLHPPLSYRGGLFEYRTADGSANNFLHPQLGKAGEPYAKSVPSQQAIQGARPDPGDLFDLLMAAEDSASRKISQLGISNMLLCHANIIIHDIFRSNSDDKNISDTSSYLDLTPLYGRDHAHQLEVRQMKKGLLKPDSFAENRLTAQPPGVCVYLIMYNRFHNYVAEQLLLINENGKFSLPAPESDYYRGLSPEDRTKAEVAAKEKQDEDLFQTARLITCGLFINISIHDYLKVLMRLHAKDTSWTLDPRIEMPEDGNKEGVQRGIGNQVSIEFNVLYRFHSPISKRDAKWTEDFLHENFRRFVNRDDGKGGVVLTQAQFDNLDIPVDLMRMAIEGPPSRPLTPKEKEDAEKERHESEMAKPFMPEGLGYRTSDKDGNPIGVFPFARDEATGKFDDAQLVKEMVAVMEDPICQFGPRNVPKAFRAIEILGILQARKWELATLNEFREFFGMSRHKRFEDINGNVEIQDVLRDLYDDPDLVELYPGLFCEGNGDWDAKKKTGSNLDPGTSCPSGNGTALWRGVFSDAVTLVRSDRFYTIDWNVASLTAWGMHEVTSDPKILKGSVFHRLFQRAFPGQFKYNSIYLWQPLYTPAKNMELAAEQNYLKDLAETRKDLEAASPNDPDQIRRITPGKRPAKSLAPMEISDYSTIQNEILAKTDLYVNPGVRDTVSSPDGLLTNTLMSKAASLDDGTDVLQELVTEENQRLFLDYFVNMSREIALRERRKFQGVTYQIDIVRDYAIPVVTRFVADFLGFGDQIKTQLDQRDRKYNENQIYQHFTNCQDYLTFNSDETVTWKRRTAYRDSMKFLKQMTEQGVRDAQPGLFEFFERSYGTKGDNGQVKELRKFGTMVARALVKEKGKTVEEAAGIMLAAALDATHKSILTFTEVIAYFLEHPKYWKAIQDLATQDTPAADEKLKRWVLEVQRIAVDLWIVRTPTKNDPNTSLHGTEGNGEDKKEVTRTVKKDDILVLKVKPASQDPKAFPNPTEVNLNRPLSSYIYYGHSETAPFDGKQLTIIGLTGMIKYAARLKRLRAAHDSCGKLKTIETPVHDGYWYMTVQWDQIVPFPTTWNLRYDGPEEGKGVYDPDVDGDNSEVGHGIEKIYALHQLSSVGGSYNALSGEAVRGGAGAGAGAGAGTGAGTEVGTGVGVDSGPGAGAWLG